MDMHMLKDIEGREDIVWLVDNFYAKVREDALLAPVFASRIHDTWDAHLETMYNFWNMAIFGVRDYQGNPFSRHVTLPLEGEHFNRWLQLFSATLDERFAGPVTDDVRRKAHGIAATFQARMNIRPQDTVFKS
ncbi:globin [Chitinophaga parva]|uniref:Globin n=2 Tax=Chitinophaga parva TaxID=2169414 RepID=A0A2T7BH32_9BACT|nr:globin [Chitinophaga parva]